MKNIDTLDSATNNTGFIRFIAASIVLLSHSYYLLDRATDEPFIKIGVITNMGGISVYAFFILSGFLIMRSWTHHPQVVHFLINRVLRIFPALTTCYIIMIFIVAPIITTITRVEYFHDPMTWDYAKNMFLFIVPFRFWLPGIFENNVNRFVNGALWTLPIEFFIYLLFAVFGLFGLFKTRLTTIYIWIMLLVLHIMNSQFQFGSEAIIFSMQLGHILQFFLFFLSGSLIYKYREYFPKVNSKLIIILFFINIISIWLKLTLISSILVFPILIIALSFIRIPKKYRIINSLGDYSYGMYIYGWFIQQLIILYFGRNLPILLNFLLCFMFSLSAGFVSWHLIEKNALKLKFRHR